jgi:hypothetical protein
MFESFFTQNLAIELALVISSVFANPNFITPPDSCNVTPEAQSVEAEIILELLKDKSFEEYYQSDKIKIFIFPLSNLHDKSFISKLPITDGCSQIYIVKIYPTDSSYEPFRKEHSSSTRALLTLNNPYVIETTSILRVIAFPQSTHTVILDVARERFPPL